MKEMSVTKLDSTVKSALYVKVLEDQLNKIRKKDPKFSIRKFAERACVDPSTMNQYLSGKRKLTEEAYKLIAKNLELEETFSKAFRKEFEGFRKLSEKLRLVRREWYYYALLEATNLASFKLEKEWIAEYLRLEREEAAEAIEVLTSTNAIDFKDGVPFDNLGNVSFIDHIDFDEEDGRHHQLGLLEEAKKSVDSVDSALKDHTSLSFSINQKSLPAIKEKIANFRKEMAKFINDSEGEVDSVYSLQFNLTPLLRKDK